MIVKQKNTAQMYCAKRNYKYCNYLAFKQILKGFTMRQTFVTQDPYFISNAETYTVRIRGWDIFLELLILFS